MVDIMLQLSLFMVLVMVAYSITTMEIKGKVFDVDGFALGNAAITLDSGDFRATSRSDGKFSFLEIPSGKHILFFFFHVRSI